jgi:hypothetical protein
MLVVRVRIVFASVRHRFMVVHMTVTVTCAGRDGVWMGVLVMQVVSMLVFVIDSGVGMRMDMLLSQMKPQAESHQCASRD